MNFLQTIRSLEREKQIDFLILFGCGLCFWVNISSLLPTLPAYIQDQGAPPRQVALVMSFFAVGLLGSRIWLGQLADLGWRNYIIKTNFNKSWQTWLIKSGKLFFGALVNYPSRKVVILIGALVVASAPLGYIIADQIPELMAVRAFHGISIAAFTTGYNALVVDLSPSKQKGELIGYMSLVIPLGTAVGPAMGGFLQQSAGYTVLFSTVAFSGLMAMILAIRVRELPELKKRQNEIENNLKSGHNEVENTRSMATLIKDISFLIPTIILLFIGTLFGCLVTFLPLYIRSLNLDFNIGLFYTATAFGSFGVRFFAGKASDRYGRGIFVTISLCFYIISMVILALANEPFWFILSAIVEGMGAGILIPVILALISDRCTFAERGKVFSLCISGFDVGVAVGGALLGSLILGFGYKIIFLSSGLLALFSLVIFIAYSNQNFANSWRFAFGLNQDDFAIISNLSEGKRATGKGQRF